jgi:hypothetical protein
MENIGDVRQPEVEDEAHGVIFERPDLIFLD